MSIYHRKWLEINHEYKPIEYVCTHSDCKIQRYVFIMPIWINSSAWRIKP